MPGRAGTAETACLACALRAAQPLIADQPTAETKIVLVTADGGDDIAPADVTAAATVHVIAFRETQNAELVALAAGGGIYVIEDDARDGSLLVVVIVKSCVNKQADS